MKRTVLPIILLATTLSSVNAQTSSSTPVIGYYKQTIPAGNVPLVCGFTTKKEFQGAMTSAANGSPNSVITQTGAGWTINQFQTSASPATQSSHFLEVLTGPANAVGMVYDIVSNTATTVTVHGSTSILTGAVTYCIRKHVTLGTLLPGGGGLTIGSDLISIVNSDASIEQFDYNGANWENSATIDDATSKVIYPGQGFIVTHSGAPATLTIGGNEVSYVKSGPTKVPLYHHNGNPPVRNLVGLINPLVSDAGATDFNTLGNFGLVGDGGVTSGITAGSDFVDVFKTDGTFKTVGTFDSNGVNLEDALTLEDATNKPVRNGASFRVLTIKDTTITIPQTHPN
jgi:hypothetical protein